MTERLRAVREGWNSFWFEPASTSTLGVLRIAFGLLVTAWAISLSWDREVFFSGSNSIVGSLDPIGSPLVIRVFLWDLGPLVVLELLFVAALCLTIGYHTRLAAILVFLGLLAMQRRNPDAMNAGDKLVLVMAFYLMFAPLGASLSLDRWRRARHEFWEFPARSMWALRLLQVQISAMYLFAVWEKLQGSTWSEGTALSYALDIQNLVRFPVPELIQGSLPLMNLLTWSVMAIELSIGVLVWFPKLRPWVLIAGVALHASIDLAMTIGFFSLAIFVSYLSFVPADTMTRRITRLRERLAR